MMDTEDQIITSRSPDIEKDAIRAATFVGLLLATLLIASLLIVGSFIAFGGPGAFFATGITVIGVSALGAAAGPK